MMIEKLLNLVLVTKIDRSDGSYVELWRGLAMPAGVESFVIRDRRTGIEHDGTTMSSVALRIFREVFALAAPAQVESPLPAAERQSSGLAGGGAAANAMSEPVREMLATAGGRDNGIVWRGGFAGEFSFTLLRAGVRRGWLQWQECPGYQPTCARITDAGRKALARELATMAGAR